MLTRRTFAVCALCAAAGFLATGAEAQTAATAGLKRTLLKQTDGPTEGYVTVEMRVDIEPGAAVARHTHPGVESGYLVEGGIDLAINRRRSREPEGGGRLSGADRGPARRRQWIGKNRSCRHLCH